MRTWLPLLLLITAACSDSHITALPDNSGIRDDDTGVDPDQDSDTETETETESETEDLVIEGEPIAHAGPDANVKPLEWVSLDGGGSRDPNDLYPLKFRWSLISKPVDSQALLLERAAVRPRFWADLAGEYVFDLTVQNDAGVWDSTADKVVITAEPTEGFYVQMSWDTESDQDLHLLRQGARFYDTPGDCSWCNMTPSWGSGGSTDDPSLDWDTIDAYGPETTTIESPATGVYSIMVHYYGQDGESECWFTCPKTEAVVRLYIDSALRETWRGTLDDQGDLWTVATVDWPSRKVTTVDAMSYTPLDDCN